MGEGGGGGIYLERKRINLCDYEVNPTQHDLTWHFNALTHFLADLKNTYHIHIFPFSLSPFLFGLDLLV